MTSTKAIFFDERERRWRSTRRILVVVAVATCSLLAVFAAAMFEGPDLPRESTNASRRPPAAAWSGGWLRSEPLAPWSAENGLASADGSPLRIGFYMSDDSGSLRSLRQHYRDLDVVVPTLLHATSADGRLTATRDPDLSTWLAETDAALDVMPMIDNFDGESWQGDGVGRALAGAESRRALVGAIERYAAEHHSAGIVIDFEEIPSTAQPFLHRFARELATGLHARGRRLVIALPAANPDYDYAEFAASGDAVLLMNYDQHWERSTPGPIASQDWFEANLAEALRAVPARKLLVGIANYAYDWTEGVPQGAEPGQSLTVQDALAMAQASAGGLALDPRSLNPHFGYQDRSHRNHRVWLLDAVTAHNQIDVATRRGSLGTALWLIGSEDPTFWALWHRGAGREATLTALEDVPAAENAQLVGEGDVWKITGTAQAGRRQLRRDVATGAIVEERFSKYPHPYRVEQRGNAPGKIALTFDDGPDPRFTPAILDTLRAKGVSATFFVIGLAAYQSSALLERIYAEGHEIGNHTYTHPDLEEISSAQLRLELVLTQRLIQSRLGISTRLFRPPYGLDDQASERGLERLRLAQQLGYVIVGSQIDANDWGDDNSATPPSPERIVATVLEQARDGDGHVVLLHDGGGNRSSTVAALPLLIDALRADGFELVPVSTLLDETRADAMPPLDASGRWVARANSIVFDSFRTLRLGIAAICLTAIILLAARSVFVVTLAFRHKRRGKPVAAGSSSTLVSVLIPAYDEEGVIAGTLASVLCSDHHHLEILVIDDGSSDQTSAVVEREFADDPRVRLFRQTNHGKSAALNRAVAEARGEILVTIDADTRVDRGTIGRLIRHFGDPAIAGVAGNTKVANRDRRLTRWQALEYISGQNLEKRAFDLLNCITVVPGAVGAWRASAIRSCGGFSTHTVAEDTDLTLTIRRRGWRIVFDDEAIARTIAPESAAALIRQRFRWTFGTLQALWKHRDAFGRERYGTLGRVALPHIVLFQIVLPIFCPVVDLLFFGSILLWALARTHVGPFLQFWTPGDVELAIVFFGAFLLIDLATSFAAFLLEPDEDWSLLLSLPLQRFYYRQLMDIVLFRALLRAVQGRAVGWGRVGPRSFSPLPEPSRAAG